MAVILIAPPGAGKGTQADLLAERYDLVHLETSRIIERNFNSADSNDAEVNAEKKRWLAGELMKPSTFVPWLVQAMKDTKNDDRGLILSGSPRTLTEVEEIMLTLRDLYDQGNIKIFNISLGDTEAVKRNSGRRICQANRHPIPNFPEYANLTTCPQDQSHLITRDLDKPEFIKERLAVYHRDTEPVLDWLTGHGYQIIKINGEQPIDKVFADFNQYF